MPLGPTDVKERHVTLTRLEIYVTWTPYKAFWCECIKGFWVCCEEHRACV